MVQFLQRAWTQANFGIIGYHEECQDTDEEEEEHDEVEEEYR